MSSFYLYVSHTNTCFSSEIHIFGDDHDLLTYTYLIVGCSDKLTYVQRLYLRLHFNCEQMLHFHRVGKNWIY